MILKYSIFLTVASSIFIYDSACYGDTCQINGLEPEVLKSLSYEPPNKELLATGQNQKAWQTFIENYEIPIRKVQDWYNSIVDKNSADAAAKSFSTEVSPILKKLTGPAADMKSRFYLFLLHPRCKNLFFCAFFSFKAVYWSFSSLCRVKGKWTTTPVTEAVIFFSILFWNLQLNQPRTLPNSLIPGMNPKSI